MQPVKADLWTLTFTVNKLCLMFYASYPASLTPGSPASALGGRERRHLLLRRHRYCSLFLELRSQTTRRVPYSPAIQHTQKQSANFDKIRVFQIMSCLYRGTCSSMSWSSDSILINTRHYVYIRTRIFRYRRDWPSTTQRPAWDPLVWESCTALSSSISSFFSDLCSPLPPLLDYTRTRTNW